MPGVKGRSGGRNAKTRKQHEIDGTYDASRHRDIDNPEPPTGAPLPPKELAGDALEEWQRMIRRLEDSQTLSTVDDGALYQYCCMFAETEALAISQQETAASLDILEENLGKLERGELVAAFQEISKLRQLEAGYANKIRQGRMGLRAWLVEFGLTPAARSRVRVSGGQRQHETPTSPLAKLQQQARALRVVS